MRRSSAGFGQGVTDKQDNDEAESEQTDSYSMALVPVDEAEMKRKRNERIKAQAKRVAGPTKVGKVLFDIDEEGTFVTGGGIPGQTRIQKPPKPNRDDIFMSEEDKLLH